MGLLQSIKLPVSLPIGGGKLRDKLGLPKLGLFDGLKNGFSQASGMAETASKVKFWAYAIGASLLIFVGLAFLLPKNSPRSRRKRR